MTNGAKTIEPMIHAPIGTRIATRATERHDIFMRGP